MLDVDGVDLRSEAVFERMASAPYEIGWSSMDGQVRAAVFVPGPDPVACVIEVVHWLENTPMDAHVARVNEELVSTTDIAAELGLSRETVRLWAQGKRREGGFPRPRATVGAGSRPIRVWAWAEVAQWLTEQMSIELDYGVLSADEVVDINAHLKRVSPRKDDGGPDAEYHALGPLMGQTEASSMHAAEQWDHTWRTPLSVNHICTVNHGFQREVASRPAAGVPR